MLYLAAPLLGWYVARVLSFLAAATATWALNRRYTFGARQSGVSLAREYLGYLLTMLGGAFVNYGVYVLVLHCVQRRVGAGAGRGARQLRGAGAQLSVGAPPDLQVASRSVKAHCRVM